MTGKSTWKDVYNHQRNLNKMVTASATILLKLLGNTYNLEQALSPTIWAQGSNSGCQFVAGPLILINSNWQISGPKNTLFCCLDNRTSVTPFFPLRKWTQGFQRQELSHSLVGPGLELQATLDLRALLASSHVRTVSAS